MRRCNGRELPGPYQNQEQLQQQHEQQQQHGEKNNISKATARESQSKHKLENGRLSKAPALFTMGLTLPKVGDMMRGVSSCCASVSVWVCACTSVCVWALCVAIHISSLHFILFQFQSCHVYLFAIRLRLCPLPGWAGK